MTSIHPDMLRTAPSLRAWLQERVQENPSLAGVRMVFVLASGEHPHAESVMVMCGAYDEPGDVVALADLLATATSFAEAAGLRLTFNLEALGESPLPSGQG